MLRAQYTTRHIKGGFWPRRWGVAPLALLPVLLAAAPGSAQIAEPTNLEAWAAVSDPAEKMDVEWDAPENDALTRHQYRWRFHDRTDLHDGDFPETPEVSNGRWSATTGKFGPGNVYEISVRQCESQLCGPYSEEFARGWTNPLPLSNIRAVSGYDTASLFWTQDTSGNHWQAYWEFAITEDIDLAEPPSSLIDTVSIGENRNKREYRFEGLELEQYKVFMRIAVQAYANFGGQRYWESEWHALVVDVGHPSLPTEVTATGGDAQVTLAWVAEEHSAIHAWEYRQKEGAGAYGNWTRMTGSGRTTREYVVKGLTNDTLYTFQIRPIAEGWQLVPSKEVSATPRVPDPLPAPTGFTAAAGDTQATLAWTGPEHSAITAWEYRQKAGAEDYGSWMSMTGSTGATREYVVEGLTNDTLYTFQIRPVAEGWLPVPSEDASATPHEPESEPLPAPTGFTATAGDTQVILAWTGPDHSAVIAWQYRQKAGSEDYGSWMSMTGSTGATREYLVEDLANDTLYTFQIRPEALDLVFPHSSEASATPHGPEPVEPGIPTALSLTPGDEEIGVAWNAPEDGGAPIDDYDVRFALAGTGDWNESVHTGTDTSHMITGLGAATRYDVQVRAGNSVGKGDWSAAATAATLEPREVVDAQTLRFGLATFARLAGSAAVDAVESRFARSSAAPGHARSVPGQPGSDPVSALNGTAPQHPESGLPAYAATGLHNGQWQSAYTGEWDRWERGLSAHEGPMPGGADSLLAFLAGNGFEWTLGASGDSAGFADGGSWGSAWTGWGRLNMSTVSNDAADGVRTDGDVFSTHVGLETWGDQWLTGLAVAYSTGDLDLSGSGDARSNALSASVTGLMPYVHLKLHEQLSLWSLVGIGRGDMTLTPQGGPDHDADLDSSMMAAGARWSAAQRETVNLALKTDAMWTRIESGDGPGLPSVSAAASRWRLALESGLSWQLPDSPGTFEALAEVGVRVDSGDAETGAGIEAGGALAYHNPEGVSAEARVRTLLSHEAEGLEEWGAGFSLRVDPGLRGQGLSLSLSPTWGQAHGGADSLWAANRSPGQGAAMPDGDAGQWTHFTVGYGMRGLLRPGTALSDAGLWRQALLWTPFAEMSQSGSGASRQRLGLRLDLTPGTVAGGFSGSALQVWAGNAEDAGRNDRHLFLAFNHRF